MNERQRMFRARTYRQLSVKGWRGHGLSPCNTVVVALIAIAVIVAILETEPRIMADPRIAKAFHALNLVFAVVFTIEYLARLWIAGEETRYQGLRGRLRYALSLPAIIDLLAVIPFYLTLGADDAFILRLLRLMRILALARLGEFSEAARLLIRCVRRRSYELTLSFSVAMAVLIFAATALYLVEGHAQPDAFGSIPRALWWSVATLTTVGYGDVYPVTVLGRVLAGITALAAIGLIAMPAGILAGAFSDAFQDNRRRKD